MSVHVGESSRLRMSGKPVSRLRTMPANPAEYGIMNTTIALGPISLASRRPARMAGITQKIDSSGHTTISRSLFNRKRRSAANSHAGRQLRTTSMRTRPPPRCERGASVTTVMFHCALSFSTSLLARMAVGVVSGENDCEMQRSVGVASLPGMAHPLGQLINDFVTRDVGTVVARLSQSIAGKPGERSLDPRWLSPRLGGLNSWGASARLGLPCRASSPIGLRERGEMLVLGEARRHDLLARGSHRLLPGRVREQLSEGSCKR